eukprot:6172419-Pleurochrysis_carterae.AAC.4
MSFDVMGGGGRERRRGNDPLVLSSRHRLHAVSSVPTSRLEPGPYAFSSSNVRALARACKRAGASRRALARARSHARAHGKPNARARARSHAGAPGKPMCLRVLSCARAS